MADYTDKAAKSPLPRRLRAPEAWRKAFNAPLESHEVARLQQLSTKVQDLWDEHTRPWRATAPAPKTTGRCGRIARKERKQLFKRAR
jgi:hypothetical protein